MLYTPFAFDYYSVNTSGGTLSGDGEKLAPKGPYSQYFYIYSRE